jgi:hypothetical protein
MISWFSVSERLCFGAFGALRANDENLRQCEHYKGNDKEKKTKSK